VNVLQGEVQGCSASLLQYTVAGVDLACECDDSQTTGCTSYQAARVIASLVSTIHYSLPQCSHRAEALGCHLTLHFTILHPCCTDKRDAHIREPQAAEQNAPSTPGIETLCNSSKSIPPRIATSSPLRYAIVVLSGKSFQDIVLHVMSS
jgi:hypothetical protein